MFQITLLCLTADNWIGIGQIGATLIVGVATILIYLKITDISASATIKAANLNDRSNRFNKLNSDLDRIVEFTIQYPYFEDDEYTHKKYRSDINSTTQDEKEKALRYELFAIMNFNFVEDLYKYYDGDEKKMGDVAYFEELIESHAEYWKYKIIEQKEGGYKLITPLVNRILKINS